MSFWNITRCGVANSLRSLSALAGNIKHWKLDHSDLDRLIPFLLLVKVALVSTVTMIGDVRGVGDIQEGASLQKSFLLLLVFAVDVLKVPRFRRQVLALRVHPAVVGVNHEEVPGVRFLFATTTEIVEFLRDNCPTCIFFVKARSWPTVTSGFAIREHLFCNTRSVRSCLMRDETWLLFAPILPTAGVWRSPAWSYGSAARPIRSLKAHIKLERRSFSETSAHFFLHFPWQAGFGLQQLLSLDMLSWWKPFRGFASHLPGLHRLLKASPSPAATERRLRTLIVLTNSTYSTLCVLAQELS